MPLRLLGKLTLGFKLLVGYKGVRETVYEKRDSTGRRFVDARGEVVFFPKVPSAFSLEASAAIMEGCDLHVSMASIS
jgi:hypothetical protein